jgi:hypothetical protein
MRPFLKFNFLQRSALWFRGFTLLFVLEAQDKNSIILREATTCPSCL